MLEAGCTRRGSRARRAALLLQSAGWIEQPLLWIDWLVEMVVGW